MISSRKIITPDKALIRLEELCARAEHCSYEIMRKLRDWGISSGDADAILMSLRERRFVDDSRFASSFVRDRYRYARWGRIKIRMQLRAKHIAAEIIEEAIAGIDEDEYRAILTALVKAKARTFVDPTAYESRTKIFRFALNRGFESSEISCCIAKN